MFRAIAFSFLVFICFAVSAARSEEKIELFGQFQPTDFTKTEIRIIQRSLTFVGDYEGLWDGEWGRLSQQALERFLTRKDLEYPVVNGDIVIALFEAEDIADGLGWSEWWFENVDVSLGIPERLVVNNPSFRGGVEFVGYGLEIRAYQSTRSGVLKHHNQVYALLTGSNPYFVRRENRWVTSGDTAMGGIAYIRSDFVGNRWVTLEVMAASAHVRELAYVTSSYQLGNVEKHGSFETRHLHALLEAAVELANQEPSDAGNTGLSKKEGAAKVASSGTGFFIGNATVISNFHVVEGCATLVDAKGGSFSIVAFDKDKDLALLHYSGYSPNYLAITSHADVALGEHVSALGFPYYGMVNKQLNFTEGVVSAVRGISDNPEHFTLSAPLQPGNSGGPILNAKGEVVGVAVAVLDSLVIAQATGGSFPQNINYAIKRAPLVDFLDEHGAIYQSTGPVLDMTNGVPSEIQLAVTPILCRN